MTEKQHKSLKDNVEAWLNKGGYPLEMRIARQLREAGWTTVSSEHYQDPKTQDLREIDVVAFRRWPKKWQSSPPFVSLVSIVVECKNNEGKPLVLFGEDTRKVAPALVRMFQIANRRGQEVLFALGDRIDRGEFLLFNHPTKVFHSVVTALRGENPHSNQGKDVAYEAINQVLSAAYARKTRQDDQDAYNVNIASLIIPVIVVSGSIFEAQLSEGGTIELEESSGGVLQIASDFDEQRLNLIWVITEASFTSWLSALTIGADQLVGEDMAPFYRNLFLS